MCGRYTSRTPLVDVARWFAVDEVVADDLGPRYNVAPTDEVYLVATDGHGGRRLGTARWGLVPGWAEDPSRGARMINARSESLLDRPAFKSAFERRRGIVPADGFYEWAPAAGGKQPWHIRPRDGGLLAFAGLWASWRRPEDGARLVTCTIITTAANETVSPLHDRMPVVLPPEVWEVWLDPDCPDPAGLQRLLVPAPAELLEAVPVSRAVGDVRNDHPGLLEPDEVPLFP